MPAAGPPAIRASKGSMAWQQHAACQWADPTLFSSIDKRAGLDDRARVEKAISYCACCPVVTECLQWALTNKESGVYGGFYLGKGGRLIDVLKEDISA